MSAPDDDKPLSINTGKCLMLKRPEIGRESASRTLPPAERRAVHQPPFFRIKSEPDGSPFFNLPEEQRTAAIKRLVEPEAAPPPPTKERKPSRERAVPYPDPDLIRWCEGYMRRMRSPRTAMEIVNHWYDTWRKHPDRPQDIAPEHKPGHVDRVTKWLEHHEKAGRLRMAGKRGSLKPGGKRTWPAKSYQPVEGAVWKRRRSG